MKTFTKKPLSMGDIENFSDLTCSQKLAAVMEVITQDPDEWPDGYEVGLFGCVVNGFETAAVSIKQVFDGGCMVTPLLIMATPEMTIKTKSGKEARPNSEILGEIALSASGVDPSTKH